VIVVVVLVVALGFSLGLPFVMALVFAVAVPVMVMPVMPVMVAVVMADVGHGHFAADALLGDRPAGKRQQIRREMIHRNDDRAANGRNVTGSRKRPGRDVLEIAVCLSAALSRAAPAGNVVFDRHYLGRTQPGGVQRPVHTPLRHIGGGVQLVNLKFGGLVGAGESGRFGVPQICQKQPKLSDREKEQQRHRADKQEFDRHAAQMSRSSSPGKSPVGVRTASAAIPCHGNRFSKGRLAGECTLHPDGTTSA